MFSFSGLMHLVSLASRSLSQNFHTRIPRLALTLRPTLTVAITLTLTLTMLTLFPTLIRSLDRYFKFPGVELLR